MKNLKLAYKKLSNKTSNVSAHYLVSRKGIIYNLVCPKYKAWHAGESKWGNHVNINEYSIGVELENRGHEFGYQNFTNKQYFELRKLISFLKKNFGIVDNDIIYHSDISPNRKQDPGEKFFIYKIGINKFKRNKRNIYNHSITFMLRKYGFHKSYVINYKRFCIMAVKRTLNYKNISPVITKKFLKDFYNLLFI